MGKLFRHEFDDVDFRQWCSIKTIGLFTDVIAPNSLSHNIDMLV